MFAKALLVLPAVLWAVAAESPPCEPVTLCIDGIDDCGNPWGGCYNTCEPDTRPTQPAPSSCDGTTPGYPEPTGDCDGSGHTVCWDGINDCGMMYGGCFPDCKPWPTFQPPPCPTTSTWQTVTTTASPTEIENCAEITICVDHVNECGMMYGGCHSVCEPTPTYTAPACPTGSYPVAPPTDGCKARKRRG